MKTPSTTILCTTTAPVFMAGANLTMPELRATSIKGVMRYIWRAAQRAVDKTDFRIREGTLFGNADGDYTCKSPFHLQVFVNQPLPTSPARENMLPHRTNPMMQPAIGSETPFMVRIIGGKSDELHLDYVRLFILTSMLGGFGRRARKGMGTVKIDSITGKGSALDKTFSLENCVRILNQLSGGLYAAEPDDNAILPVPSSKEPLAYPYIKKIIIISRAQDVKVIQKRIAQSLHTNRQKHPAEKYLGNATGEKARFASSILLSTIPADNTNQYSCIVTQLNCTVPADEADIVRYLLELESEMVK